MCLSAKFVAVTARAWSVTGASGVVSVLPLCRAGSHAAALQSALPARSVGLRGSGEVAPSAPRTGGPGTLPRGVVRLFRRYQSGSGTPGAARGQLVTAGRGA